jgi:8-oxo-dGTP pyrophosphatase MutT (NUDIX family)
MSLEHDSALRKILNDHLRLGKDQKPHLNSIDRLWKSDADMTSRKTFPTHLTASAILLRGSDVLMIEHKALSMWLFPGGHMEAGEWPHETAARELREETGHSASLYDMVPIDIDCHVIPENGKKVEPEHFHIDFRYLFMEFEKVAPSDSREITDMKWVLYDAIPSRYLRIAKAIAAKIER